MGFNSSAIRMRIIHNIKALLGHGLPMSKVIREADKPLPGKRLEIAAKMIAKDPYLKEAFIQIWSTPGYEPGELEKLAIEEILKGE